MKAPTKKHGTEMKKGAQVPRTPGFQTQRIQAPMVWKEFRFFLRKPWNLRAPSAQEPIKLGGRSAPWPWHQWRASCCVEFS